MHRTDKHSLHSSITRPVWLNGWVFLYEISGCGFESRCSHLKLQMWSLLWARSSLTFSQTIECRSTLKLVRVMIIICSQMHRTDNESQHSSIIWPVWLNGWVFSCELICCGFKPPCCHLKLQIWPLFRARSSLILRQTIGCGFTLKLVHDMIMAYTQIHRTDNYSQYSSII